MPDEFIIRERILNMGVAGSGKSYQQLLIARAIMKSGRKMYIIDTDDAIPYMLHYQFPDLEPRNGGNVYVKSVLSWQSHMEALSWAMAEGKEGDWISIDLADVPWETVTRYFVSEVFKKDIGDYFLEARKRIAAGKSAGKKEPKSVMQEALGGWMDWGVINKLYDDFMLPIIYNTPCNIYLAAKIRKLTNEDDNTLRSLYGPWGIRPAGQKNMSHQVHTIFISSQGRDGEWYITTVKDRGNRPYYLETPLSSLYMQYLVPYAGFEIA